MAPRAWTAPAVAGAVGSQHVLAVHRPVLMAPIGKVGLMIRGSSVLRVALSSVPLFLTLSTALGTAPAAGQDAPAALTAADYERAERRLWDHTDPLVLGGWPNPQWLEDGRFWYWNRFESGSEYIIVDPAAGERERAFDHARMAAALAAETGEEYSAFALPRGELALEAGSVRFEVAVEGETYACGLDAARCDLVPPPAQAPGRFDIVSPDGTKAAFIRDHNLWLRDLTTGETTQLTEDGIEDFGYATNNAGWTKSDRPVLKWSPDSRRIATFQHDGRGVGMMYMVTTEVGHPELEAWRYPLPEDSVIFRIHRVVIDTEAPAGSRVVRLDMPPDQHRSTVCDHVACRGTFSDVGVELRRLEARLRLQFARPQAGARPRRRHEHGSGPRPVRGSRGDVLRVPRQLALSLSLRRNPLVLAAGRLGAPLPLRRE